MKKTHRLSYESVVYQEYISISSHIQDTICSAIEYQCKGFTDSMI